METEVGIDGESLGLVVINKCDAIESVLYSLFHNIWLIPKVLSQKTIILLEVVIMAIESYIASRSKRIEVEHSGTLLACTLMVILGLHLKEVEPTIHIASYSQLLAIGMSRMMTVVHLHIWSIEIHGVVSRLPFAFNLLGTILPYGKLQQLPQSDDIGNKLSISAIHKSYTAHFLKSYWLIIVKDVGHEGLIKER